MAKRLEAAGYFILVISASFGGWGTTLSYDFAFLLKPRGGAYYVISGAICPLWRRKQKGDVSANWEEV